MQILEALCGICGAVRRHLAPNTRGAVSAAVPPVAALWAGFRRMFGTIQTSPCESASFPERVKIARKGRKEREPPSKGGSIPTGDVFESYVAFAQQADDTA